MKRITWVLLAALGLVIGGCSGPDSTENDTDESAMNSTPTDTAQNQSPTAEQSLPEPKELEPVFECRNQEYKPLPPESDVTAVWANPDVKTCDVTFLGEAFSEVENQALITAYGASNDADNLAILYSICSRSDPYLAGNAGQLAETQGAAIPLPRSSAC